MRFSFVKERENKNKKDSSDSGFDQKLDETAYSENNSFAKLIGMTEKDFRKYIKKDTTWKCVDGRLLQRPK